MGMLTKQRTVNRVVLLDTDKISPSPYQPRRQFDRKSLHELAESIAQSGLLQPITVRETNAGFELIAGERRLMACKMLHMEQIPAIVEHYDDEKSAVFALVENLQRRDLNYFEEAIGIQQLMEHYNMTQQQIAKRLGKAQSTIANKLRLLNFSEPMRRRMLDAGLTERHARALLKLSDELSVNKALQHIVSERLNVGESERYIQTMLEPEEPQKPKPTRLFIVKDLRIFLNTITRAISTMKLAGIEVDTRKTEDDEYIHYTMRIPKKSAYKSKSHSA